MNPRLLFNFLSLSPSLGVGLHCLPVFSGFSSFSPFFTVVFLLLKSVRIQSVLASASQKIQIRTSNTEGVISKLVVRCGFGLEARTGSSWGKKDADSSDHKVAVRFENFHGEEGK